MSAESPEKHAFVSYVREDSSSVDELGRILAAAGIPFWRDRSELGPGDMWRSKIRDAIKSGALAFVVCFSTRSNAKAKSYQNEELTLAVEEFRMRPPGRTWLIPVRLDDCEIPEWDLGAGRMLADVNYIDMFGDNKIANAVRLVETIKKVMGLPSADPRMVRTAVEEADAAARPELLRRLTKEMLLDPGRQIELDDLITQEVSRVIAAMRDPEQFPDSYNGAGTDNERVVQLAETATKYWELVEPFCWSLQVAARFGSPETLGPWIRGLQAFSAEALKPKSGLTVLLDLRNIPILVSIVVAALASTGKGSWENFRTLLVDNTVADPGWQGKRVAIIEMTSPYDPFGYGEITSHVLARSIMTGDDFDTATTEYNKKYGRFHSPAAEWLFALLKPVFIEQFPDEDTYVSAFDYAEAAIGIVNEDLGNARDSGEGRPVRFRNRWFGRSTWRYAHRHGDPVEDLADEHATRGSAWGPLQVGLFGGAPTRATAAIERYRETFREIARNQW